MTTQIPRLLATIFEYFHPNFLKRILKDLPSDVLIRSNIYTSEDSHILLFQFACPT